MTEGAKTVGSAVGSGVSTVGNVVSEGAKTVGSAVTEGAKAVGSGVVSVGSAVTDGAKAVGSAVGSGVSTVGNVVSEGAKTVGNKVTEGAKAVGSGVSSVGSAVTGGFSFIKNNLGPFRIFSFIKNKFLGPFRIYIGIIITFIVLIFLSSLNSQRGTLIGSILFWSFCIAGSSVFIFFFIKFFSSQIKEKYQVAHQWIFSRAATAKSSNEKGVTMFKGEAVCLTRKWSGLKKVMIGLGWEVNESRGADFKLNARALLLGEDGKCPKETDTVFSGNLEHSSGAVKYQSDTLTGEGDKDHFVVELKKVPVNIVRLAFIVTIHEAEERRQNFGQVHNTFIRVKDEASGKELVRFELSKKAFSTETAVVMGELVRSDNEWLFSAVGKGCQDGLAVLCERYGIQVE